MIVQRALDRFSKTNHAVNIGNAGRSLTSGKPDARTGLLNKNIIRKAKKRKEKINVQNKKQCPEGAKINQQ